MLERRHESRIRVQLSVVIFGVDGNGKRFTRTVPATNISRSGALLTDVDVRMRCGDYLAIQYSDQRANFRVVWLRDSHWEGHFRIAVHKIENQSCPWEEVLSEIDKRPQSIVETTIAELDQAMLENWGMDFSASSLPMWVFDRKTLSFLIVNETAINAYGYSREEFSTMTILDIRPKEDVRAVLGAALGPHTANGALEIWRHRRKDGSVVEIVLSARPLILDGRPAELIAIHKMAEAGAAAVP